MLSSMQRIGMWAVLTAMSVFATTAHAVVGNVLIVDTSGQAIPDQTVTIVFPDGKTTKEGETRKGILIFDFPNDGNYRIRWAGGETTHVVTGAGAAAGGIGTMGWVAGGLGLAAATTGLIGRDGGGGDDDGDSGSPGGGGGGVDGTYQCSASQVSNQDGHPIGTLSGSYDVSVNGTSVTIQHTSGNTDFTIPGTLSGNNITASGTGTFVGRSGSQFSFTGTIPPLSGQLQVTCSACPDTDGDTTADPVQVNESCTGP